MGEQRGVCGGCGSESYLRRVELGLCMGEGFFCGVQLAGEHGDGRRVALLDLLGLW